MPRVSPQFPHSVIFALTEDQHAFFESLPRKINVSAFLRDVLWQLIAEYPRPAREDAP